MGIDLDPLYDILDCETVKKTSPAIKFEPKAKFRPVKKELARGSVNSSHKGENSDGSAGKSRELGSTTIPSERDDQRSSGVSEKDPMLGISGSSVGIDDVSENNGGCHTHMEKSNADIFIRLEAPGDFLPPNAADLGTAYLDAPNPEKAAGLDVTGISSFKELNHSCNVGEVPTCTELSEGPESFSIEDPIILRTDGGGGKDTREFGNEETDIMDSVLATETATVSGKKAGKFQPKPKIQRQKEICEAASPTFAAQAAPPQIDITGKNSVPEFDDNATLNFSSIDFTHSMASVAVPGVPLNEESTNVMERTHLDSDMHWEGGPEIPSKLASRRAKATTTETRTETAATSQQQDADTSGQENEFRRSLRPRKSKTISSEPVTTAADEVLDDEEFTTLEEDQMNNEENQEESESQAKKRKHKAGKADENKGQPDEKRKKSGEASQKDARAKPKKFAHSTRRRQVDKTLLETPEDELDRTKVPLRDLILLAEHNEKQMKKEAAAAAPAVPQSNVASQEHVSEDENFSSREGWENNEEEGTRMVEDTTAYFNYQTYMDKTPTMRWTKQDTELFYEAIRQFGTDLSMIQHLFPGRTRRQLKLKYKKEERQHPFRLNEALSSRSKDHSHFKTVIERLRQIAAEEKQNNDEDESIDLTGNDEAETEAPRANLAEDEEAKDEHVNGAETEAKGEKDVGDVPHDQVEVESSMKADESEDELFDWDQYKSVI